MARSPNKHPQKETIIFEISSVCVCVCVLTEVCFDDVLVLCFVMGYVLNWEKWHIKEYIIITLRSIQNNNGGLSYGLHII